MKQSITICIYLCLCVVVAATAHAQLEEDTGWSWLNPLPQGNTLRDVSFANPLSGTAVGDAGTIIRTTDGGQSWMRLRSGTSEDLWGVSFTDEFHGIAVGANGAVVRTTDGGETWITRSINSINTLRSVTFTDASTGVAVEDLGRVFRTTDGGDTWSQLPSPGIFGLLGVAFTDANTGTAVGFNGSILRTTNGGSQWLMQNSGTTQHLFAVFFATPELGYAVGTGGVILRTINGGTTWSNLTTGTFQPLYSVSFADSLRGAAVGLPGTNYRTTDGGLTWFSQSSGTEDFLWKVEFVNDGIGFAVGNNGTIMSSSDGGSQWYTQSSGTTNSLFGVCFTDVNRGTAVGDLGRIVRTVNGGTTWVQQASGTTRSLWSVSFSDALLGLAVGNTGTILRTTNAGTTWNQQTSNTINQLLAVSFADGSVATAVGNSGTILRSTDGGITWAGQTSGVLVSLNSVDMIDAATAVSVGGGGSILRTTNGGATWVLQNSATTQTLNGVSFVDINNGFVVGANGVILRTTNGGTTWTPQSSGTSFVLNSAAFSSPNAGSAVGVGGTILRTTNGGTTWRRQASNTTNYLSSVSFVNDMVGTTVGAGGTILKTTTGGDPPAPLFSPGTTSIDFGNVLVGENKVDSVVVTNSGTGTLNISQVGSDNSRFHVTPANAILSPAASRTFYVTFTPVSTGIREGHIIFTTNAAAEPDTVAVQGNGTIDGLGKFLTVTPDTITVLNASGKFLKPVKRRKGLYPTWANLFSEVIVQGGFQPFSTESDVVGGMRVGISHMGLASPGRWKPFPDSAAVRCWVRLTRWSPFKRMGSGYAFMQKTLLDHTGKHTGPARGFDGTGVPGEPGRRPLVKQLVRLSPRKHSNVLFAELVALKFNIAASQLGKTPAGFGELRYDDAGSPYHDHTVYEISREADSAMTYWQGRSQAFYDNLYTTIYAINRAFVGSLDTLSFEADGELILNGSVDLGSVPFLKPGLVPPTILPRTTELTESPEDSDFGEEEFENEDGVPVVARLYQNFPNPFNPSTSISFRLREPATATLKVYNVVGQEILTLASGEEFEEGYHIIEFDARGLSSGVYFYQLHLHAEESGLLALPVRKMMVIK